MEKEKNDSALGLLPDGKLNIVTKDSPKFEPKIVKGEDTSEEEPEEKEEKS